MCLPPSTADARGQTQDSPPHRDWPVLHSSSHRSIYWVFGLYDGVFFVPLALLLAFAAMGSSSEEPAAVSAR